MLYQFCYDSRSKLDRCTFHLRLREFRTDNSRSCRPKSNRWLLDSPLCVNILQSELTKLECDTFFVIDMLLTLSMISRYGYECFWSGTTDGTGLMTWLQAELYHYATNLVGYSSNPSTDFVCFISNLDLDDISDLAIDIDTPLVSNLYNQ